MKRSRQTVPISDLSPEQRAAIERQLGAKPAVLDSRIQNAHPGPSGPRYRSKAERDYAAWLSSRDGVPVVCCYERVRVAVEAARGHYTPDFVHTATNEVGAPLCARVAVEVKGTKDDRPYYREGARRRVLDGAAALWRWLGLRLYVAWSVDGVWHHELVPVRGDS